MKIYNLKKILNIINLNLLRIYPWYNITININPKTKQTKIRFIWLLYVHSRLQVSTKWNNKYFISSMLSRRKHKQHDCVSIRFPCAVMAFEQRIKWKKKDLQQNQWLLEIE